jgi:hypothetical protein
VTAGRFGAAFLVGALACVIVALATASPGPGLDPDAMSYLGAAQSLVRYDVYRVPTSSWAASDSSEPLSHFPPGFSTAIAVPVSEGLSPVQSARLLIVVAAFCTWAGIVLVVSAAAGTGVGVMTGVVALATPALLNVHLSVLSEPLFLAVLVAILAGIVEIIDPGPRLRGRREWRGVWAASWTGPLLLAAVMLRYAGVALVGAAAIAALIGPVDPRRRWRTRIIRLVLISVPAAWALSAWLVRSVHLAGAKSVRALGLYGNLGETVREGLGTARDWLVPAGDGQWRGPVAWMLGAGAVMLAIHAWRRRRQCAAAVAWLRQNPEIDAHRAAVLLRAVVLTGGVYLAFVAVSRAVADPSIPFDERILSPAILLAEIGLGVALALWWPGRGQVARVAVGFVVMAWFLASAVTSATRVQLALGDGNDFAGSDWRDSPTVAWVRAPDGGANRVLYTNWPAALYFNAGRASHDVPDVTDALTLRRFRDRLARSHGVVVAFSAPNSDVAPPDSVARVLGLRQIARFSDGSVWGLARDSAVVGAGVK